jgi:hypothetical protein
MSNDTPPCRPTARACCISRRSGLRRTRPCLACGRPAGRRCGRPRQGRRRLRRSWRRRCRRARGARLPRQDHHARLHRHPPALPADRHDRLAGARPAALAGNLYLPDRAPVHDPAHAARPPTSSSTNCCATAPPPPGLLHRAPESVDAFFEASAARNLRMAAGKVLMDRHCPDFLRDRTAGMRDSEELIKRWHKQGRALYAITPRFAPTSTEAQLAPPANWRAPIRTPSSRPTSRKTRTKCSLGGRAVPAAPQLPGRVRPLRPDAPARHVRPLHLARRRRLRAHGRNRLGRSRTARPRTCSWAAACSTSRGRQGRRAALAGHRRGRRHLVLDVANDE